MASIMHLMGVIHSALVLQKTDNTEVKMMDTPNYTAATVIVKPSHCFVLTSMLFTDFTEHHIKYALNKFSNTSHQHSSG